MRLPSWDLSPLWLNSNQQAPNSGTPNFSQLSSPIGPTTSIEKSLSISLGHHRTLQASRVWTCIVTHSTCSDREASSVHRPGRPQSSKRIWKEEVPVQDSLEQLSRSIESRRNPLRSKIRTSLLKSIPRTRRTWKGSGRNGKPKWAFQIQWPSRTPRSRTLSCQSSTARVRKKEISRWSK